MNKAELIEALVQKMKVTHDRAVSKADATAFLDSFIDTVTKEVKNSEITLTGFGKFSVSERPARKGRNPSTGAEINIPASIQPKFTPGKLLKEAVNR